MACKKLGIIMDILLLQIIFQVWHQYRYGRWYFTIILNSQKGLSYLSKKLETINIFIGNARHTTSPASTSYNSNLSNTALLKELLFWSLASHSNWYCVMTGIIFSLKYDHNCSSYCSLTFNFSKNCWNRLWWMIA